MEPPLRDGHADFAIRKILLAIDPIVCQNTLPARAWSRPGSKDGFSIGMTRHFRKIDTSLVHSDLLSDEAAAEVVANYEGCRLCWALSELGQRFPANCVLWTGEEFSLIPALGSLVDGYVLLVSQRHKGSVATLSIDSCDALEQCLDAVLTMLRPISPRWLWFEHGTIASGAVKACCIDHLHLHLLPLDFDLAAEVVRRTGEPPRPVSSLGELSHLLEPSSPNYMLIGNPDGRMSAICPPAYPSQYVRQVIAACLGSAEMWDWRSHPQEERVLATIERFKESGLTRRWIYFAHAIEGLTRADILAEVERIRLEMGTVCPRPRIISMFELLEPAFGPYPRNPERLVATEVRFLRACDLLLVDLSRPEWQYVGALMEIVYAHALGIPIVVVVGSSEIGTRRWLQAHATQIVETYREAAEAVSKIWPDEATAA